MEQANVSDRCIADMALSDGGSLDLDGRNNGGVTNPAFMRLPLLVFVKK